MERTIANTKNERAQENKTSELSASHPIAVIVFRSTSCCSNVYFTVVTWSSQQLSRLISGSQPLQNLLQK